MTEIEPQSPPKNSREIGIHLVYMSKAIDELKAEMQNVAKAFATKQELLDAIKTRRIEQEQIIQDICDINNRVDAVEKIINSIKNRIVAASITVLVLMILAQWGLDKFFRG